MSGGALGDKGEAAPAGRRCAALALKAAISAGLLVWLGWRFDWGSVLGTFRSLDWRAPLVAWIAVLAALSLWPLRLRSLLRAQGVSSAYRPLLVVTFVGYFLGNFLPSSMGGDAVKLGLLLRRHRDRKGRVTLSLVADRFANILATFLLLAVVTVVPGLLSPGLAGVRGALRMLVAGVVAGLLGLGLAFHWLRRWLRRVHRNEPPRHWREKVLHLAHRGVIVVSNWVSAPATLAAAVGLSVVSTLIFFGASRTLASGLGITTSWSDWIAIQGILSVVGILPISLNGLGVQEVSFVWLLGLLGVTPELGLAFALFNRVIFVAASLPGALGLVAGVPGRDAEAA